MFLFPPTSIGNYSHRYGKEDLGDLKGDLIPLGIAALAAYLRQHNFGVGALDCVALNISHDEIIDIIKKKKPKSVAISATTYALPASTKLSERLRKEFPDLLIILGGSHANVAGMDAAKNIPSVDIVSYHPEGETVVLQIIKEFKTSKLLREMSFGKWENHLFKNIISEYPKLVKEYAEASDSFRAPEGESFGDMHVRSVNFIEKINMNDQKEILIVSHGGFMRVLLCSILGLPKKNLLNFQFENCSITEIIKYENKEPILTKINYTDHLN